MKPNLKSIIRLVLLGLSIVLILLFGIIYFISGPININKTIDEDIFNETVKKNRLSGCELGNRFTDDKTYYVAKCVAHYVVYDTEGNVLTKKAVKDLDLKLLNIDSINEYDTSLGYYQNRLVFVVKNEKREILVDYDTYEILRDYTLGR